MVQIVAIKQMKMTKSKEFYSELKVLCKVHHTNLVSRLDQFSAIVYDPRNFLFKQSSFFVWRRILVFVLHQIDWELRTSNYLEPQLREI
jgi:hypothetical protein